MGGSRQGVLLRAGATLLAGMVLARFGFNPLALFEQASTIYGSGVLAPGRLVSDPIDAISLGLALMLGTAGLPHILMRFYTVPDAKTARTSVGYATAFIGFFYLLTFVLGFGAMVILGRDAITKIDPAGTWPRRCGRGRGRHAVSFSASSPRWRSRRSWRSSPGSLSGRQRCPRSCG